MRLAFLLLVACGSKDAKVPAIETLDRTCTIDDDCVLAADVCCTACSDGDGAPVSRAAWDKTQAARAARCAKQRCPDINCATPPACREEAFAVCKAGRCERELRATAACADTACATAADCTLHAFRDCCDHCGGEPMSKTAAARKRGEAVAACGAKVCPAIDCPVPRVDCVRGQCVLP